MALWGICYDEKLHKGKLFLRPVMYTVSEETAQITEPRTGETSLTNIRPIIPPQFPYGTEVEVFGRPGKRGKVAEIIWNSKNMMFCYKLYIKGRKRIKKYEEPELMKVREEKAAGDVPGQE